ncbi:MAG TPA: TolC family protein [Cyclobacteriaceae bacterium]|nr:TolC family protein [Cyclobacteriaceae bacterium]
MKIFRRAAWTRINIYFLPAFVSAMMVALHVRDVAAQSSYTMQSAILRAKSSSPLLKTEAYNINFAQSDLVTAKLHTNPVLNNQTLQLVDSKYFAAGTDATSRYNRQVWWQLTKPFTPPSQRRNRIDIASQNILLYQKGFAETIRNFTSDVANQWLAAWIFKSRLDLLDQAYTNIDSLVKINRARLRNQVITQTDVIRTQLLQDQYQLQISNAHKDYKREIQRLKFLMGARDSVDVDIDAAIETMEIPATIDSMVSQAMRERTDIQAANLNILISQTNIKYQKSLVIPTPELGMIWNPQNAVPYVGFFGTLRIPLFDRNQGEIEKSKYRQLQAEESMRNIQLKLTTEVQAAYTVYQTEKENLKKYENMLNQSDQVLDNVRYSYLKGGTTIIDFLDAQRSWFDTRQLFLDARLSYFQSYIQLLFVTGLINQL